VVRLLLADHRVDPGADDNRAFQKAGKNGHVEVIKVLLADPRVNPAANGNNAIQLASGNGHVEVVKLLLTDPRVDAAHVNEPADHVTLPLIRLAKATKCCESYPEQFQDLKAFSDLLNWKDRFLVKRLISNCSDECELKTALTALLKNLQNDASEMYAYLRLFLIPDVAKRIFQSVHEY